MNRIVSLILCAFMLLSLLPFNALAEDAVLLIDEPVIPSEIKGSSPDFDEYSLPPIAENLESYSGTCGDDLVWSLDADAGILSITGSGKMSDYGYHNAPWYLVDGTRRINTILISGGVTSIGADAFRDFLGLTSITIPDSVTTIGGDAFYGCTSLTSITIPSSVTFIGEWAFSYCENLSSVTISNGVSFIGSAAFYHCNGLPSITIPPSVITIKSDVFMECANLASASLGDGLVSLEYGIFFGCEKLKEISIGKNLQSIDARAFEGCTSLETIYVSPENTAFSWIDNCLIQRENKALVYGRGNCLIPADGSVTSIGDYAFSGCSGLTSITVPGSVYSIGSHAFEDCKGLSSVYLSDGVASIGYHAFSGCTGLTSVTVPDSVTRVGWYAFSGCTRLAQVCYGGSPEDWNRIWIENENLPLLNAERSYRMNLRLSVGSATVHRGDTVTVTVRVSGGMAFENVSLTPVVGNGLALQSRTGRPQNGSVVSTLVAGANYRLNNGGVDTEVGGTLFTFTVQVKDDAPVGATTVDLSDLIVKTADGTEVTSKSIPLTLTVEVPATGIALDRETLELSTGQPEGVLHAFLTPDDATPVFNWSTKRYKYDSESDAIRFTSDGSTVYITALKEGTANLTVTTLNGLSASCVINVTCSHLHVTVYDRIESNCYEPGWDSFTFCNDCQKVIEGRDEELPLNENAHVFGDVSYIWSADFSTCTAFHVCVGCGYTESETVTASAGVENGDRIFTAVFEKEGFDPASTRYGDANGDGEVTNKDIVRLKNYFANFDPETETSTYELSPGADANGDGEVTNKDIVRLKNYFANFDPETGTSTYALGPAA